MADSSHVNCRYPLVKPHVGEISRITHPDAPTPDCLFCVRSATMMDSIDISKATGLLGEIRKIIVHQDELIRQKQMDIEDLQRERDGLRQQVVQLTIQLESSHTNARIESPTAAVGGV